MARLPVHFIRRQLVVPFFPWNAGLTGTAEPMVLNPLNVVQAKANARTKDMVFLACFFLSFFTWILLLKTYIFSLPKEHLRGPLRQVQNRFAIRPLSKEH